MTDCGYYAASLLTEKCNEKKKLYAAFTEVKKAFDRVARKALSEHVGVYGVGGNITESDQATKGTCENKWKGKREL